MQIIKINDMHIIIYDKHKNSYEKNPTESSLILGVHSFNQYLIQFENKKNLKILINGDPKQVVENILWNQFFSYTLLKDIYRTVSCSTQSKNSFLKINGKAYRLIDYLQWKSVQQLQSQLMKYLIISIQCFMPDGSIKTVNIQIGGGSLNSYDLIFQYQPNQCNQSIALSSMHKRRNQTFSNYSKPKQGSQADKNFATKSLFQEKPFKQKLQISSSKYSTEKKQIKNKKSCHKKCINVDPIQRQSYSKSKGSRKSLLMEKSDKSDKQNQFISIKQTVQNYEHNPQKHVQADNYSKKQQLAATLLYKKEEKIKQYRNIMEQKEQYYEQKLQKMQKNHQIEIADIKKQVQAVLTNYKKKNKQLRKQNACLVEINQKLSISNRKFEQTIESISVQLDSVQSAQQKIQQSNRQYVIKLQSLQTANAKLSEQLHQQHNVFREQMNQKNQLVNDIKGKYERLLGNIKMAADKQNLF